MDSIKVKVGDLIRYNKDIYKILEIINLNKDVMKLYLEHIFEYDTKYVYTRRYLCFSRNIEPYQPVIERYLFIIYILLIDAV